MDSKWQKTAKNSQEALLLGQQIFFGVILHEKYRSYPYAQGLLSNFPDICHVFQFLQKGSVTVRASMAGNQQYDPPAE
jgi:hypothetical protein